MPDKETFNDEQLNLIRDTFAEILWYPEVGNRFVLESEEDALGIINTCQRLACNQEFESVEQFRADTSCSWAKEPEVPVEQKEEDE